MRPSLTSLAGFVFRRRWLIIAAWAVLLIASAFLAPKLSEVTQGGGFDLPDSESWRAADILQNRFGQGYRRSVQIVFSDPELKADDPAFRQQVQDAIARTAADTGAVSHATFYDTGLPEMVSNDRTATYAFLGYTGSEDAIQPLVPRIRELVAQGTTLETHIIGGPAVDYDMEKTSESDLIHAETYSLPVILIILIFVFGSLAAAALPLILGVASVAIALALLFILGHWVSLSVFVRNMVTMVGLGLGVDYSLFIVSRFREELAAGDSIHDAIRGTLDTAGRAVTFSGAAVIVGMAMMTLFNFVFMRSLGVGGMLVAALSVLLAVTLLPAILSVIRERVNSARVLPARYLQAGGGRFWHIWSRMVMSHPVVFLVASISLLLALAWPVTQMHAGTPGIDNLSPSSDARVGLEQFSREWGVGAISPIYVVVTADGANSVWSSDFRQALGQLGQKLKDDPRVERVDSIAELGLPRELPRDPQQLAALIRDNPVTAARAFSLVDIAGGSNTTIMRITPSIEPRANEAKQLVRDLRAEMLPQISFPSNGTTLVGGGPAEAVDFTDRLSSSFPYLMAAVLIITYIVLLLLFRSVLLPLKAIFMNLLSVSAAFGVLVLVFQEGWGESVLGFTAQPGIIPFVPVILFSVLFGLSMDYEVFLLSRMKEEYELTGDNEDAVAYGLEKTGRIITSAALIMIAVFGSFALTDSIIIKEFGVGLAVSIFLDATVVRIIVVPATMKLLGSWNWWMPKWLARILPDLGIERHG